MVWPLIPLFLALVLPCPAFADDEVLDVSIDEQPAPTLEQPDASFPEFPQVLTSEPQPLYDDDGLLVSTPESPVDAAPRAALPSSLYGSVQPNNSYSIFADAFLPKLGWSDDYVFFRSAQNEYYLVFGDLSLDSGRFTGTDVSYIRWYYTSSSTGYLQESGTGSLSLRVDDFIVLSSLGDYPTLSNGSNSLHVFAWISVVFVSCYVMSRILGWLLRTRLEVVDCGPSR